MASSRPGDPVLDCGGEMAGRFASFDWSSTPLGPMADWSPSLRSTVAMLLRSRFPMILSWGPELVMLYNDAFIPTLGAKHPQALGGRLAEQFAEVWDEVGPMQRAVLAGGDATYFEDLPLVIERGDGPEETFFTFSYSHVPDDESPGGVLAVLAVTTGAVVGARRLRLLNGIGTATAGFTSPDKAMAACLDLLGAADEDLAHGAVYYPDADGTLVRSGSFGSLPEGWPVRVGAGSPLHSVWLTGQAVVAPEPRGQGPGDEPAARWQVALPVRARDGVMAVLQVAPRALRPLDDDHRAFLDLLGEQVSQAITQATARADEQARLDALAAIDAAKSELLSSVSHEFRTPLTLLLGPLEDALDGRRDALDDATIEGMHQGAHRLLRMVNDLLDIARIDADGDVVDARPTDVSRLTDDLLGPFRVAASRVDLSFDVEVEDGIGVVETDPRLWEKMLVNLVANALKYTHEGGVSVCLATDDDELVLRVADTGIGIAETEVGRVFDRFHRVSDATGRTKEGTGLGLSLVAEAASAQGGRAEARSRHGEGSTFEVRLPLIRISDPPVSVLPRTWSSHGARAMASEVAPELGSGTGAGAATPRVPTQSIGGSERRPRDREAAREVDSAGLTILVVDDNHAMRGRLRHVLGEIGHVVTCADGEEALAVLRTTHVDLVVTDVMMPRLDGLGLLQAIRADDALAPTPVLVLSARAGAEAATDALQMGADDYVVKPFTRSELLARCRTSLEMAELRGQASALSARAAMVAGVSHDMLTPLSVISSVLETLSEPELDPGTRVALSRRAAPRAEELERLIRQFLDWSRLTAGAEIATFQTPTDLAELVREVAQRYAGAEVAETTGPVVASCDPWRTRQILHNLLANATRVARSHVRVTITEADASVTGEGAPRAYDVVVADDGDGVSQEAMTGLFTPYAPSDRQDGRTNGLGLYVSREAARAQGGDVVLESTDESGATFVLRVPAAT